MDKFYKMAEDFDSFMLEAAERIKVKQEDIPEWIRNLSDKALCTFINEYAMVPRPTTFELIDEFKLQPKKGEELSPKKLYEHYIRLMQNEAKFRGHTLKVAADIDYYDVLYIQNQLHLVMCNTAWFRRRPINHGLLNGMDEVVFVPVEDGLLNSRFKYIGYSSQMQFCVLRSQDAINKLTENNEGR